MGRPVLRSFTVPDRGLPGFDWAKRMIEMKVTINVPNNFFINNCLKS
jgi:hypothetical protein